jgi:uncharacterized membrane protein
MATHVDPSSPKRSLAKATSWESISTILTAGICYPFTANLFSSIEIAGVCLFVKIVFFYMHERAWHKVNWGKRL